MRASMKWNVISNHCGDWIRYWVFLHRRGFGAAFYELEKALLPGVLTLEREGGKHKVSIELNCYWQWNCSLAQAIKESIETPCTWGDEDKNLYLSMVTVISSPEPDLGLENISGVFICGVSWQLHSGYIELPPIKKASHLFIFSISPKRPLCYAWTLSNGCGLLVKGFWIDMKDWTRKTRLLWDCSLNSSWHFGCPKSWCWALMCAGSSSIRSKQGLAGRAGGQEGLKGFYAAMVTCKSLSLVMFVYFNSYWAHKIKFKSEYRLSCQFERSKWPLTCCQI